MHLLPDAFVRPPGESFVDAVPVPIPGRGQPPLGAGAFGPQDGFHETFAILFLTDIQVGAATQEIENPAPLFRWRLNI